MPNYTAIADRAVELIGSADPAQYQAAYDLMIEETITQDKAEARYSELDILSELGAVEGDAILGRVEAGVSARIQRAIQSENGIDLADPQSKEMLTALKASGAITQADYDALIGLTSETVDVWPGLKPGHVQSALRWRQEGEI